MSDLKSAPSGKFLLLESRHLLTCNTQIWAFGLEVWKRKPCRKCQISSIFNFWVVSLSLRYFFGSFWLESASIGFFWVLASTCNNLELDVCKSLCWWCIDLYGIVDLVRSNPDTILINWKACIDNIRIHFKRKMIFSLLQVSITSGELLHPFKHQPTCISKS